MDNTNNAIATRHDAIDYARQNPDAVICKYADPTEGAREGLTIAEAEQILREDPSLIYVVDGLSFAISTDSSTEEIKAASADDAARKYAAGEGWRGVATAAGLRRYIERAGGYGTMTGPDGARLWTVSR